jgi:nitric oxide reductase activation protein
MLQMVRQIRNGGSPGADALTHWSRTRPRSAVRSLASTLTAETVTDAFGAGSGLLYPEWDVHQQSYRRDWCTVKEIDPQANGDQAVEWLSGHGLRRPLARLGMGLGRFHRQPQGDDIDIDAAIESRIELLAGSVPDEGNYIESLRHRRDLSVLILLDISGSVAQISPDGQNVYEKQRQVAASLITVLYELGDRVALYAFNSQGRSSVQLVPVKRFDDKLDSLVMRRLHKLIPGAYSRLGAAIRHAASVLIERGGTSRRLLLVLSDGLAYDHGYEPDYGAADARQALAEARRDGVGCLCLTVGASTDSESLRRVFGSAAHAFVPGINEVGRCIGPLFRSALRSAEVRRQIA